MKYVIQRTVSPCKGDYYARNSLYITSNLSDAAIYDTEQQASNHPIWNEYFPKANIVTISEKELFKAKLAKT